MIQRVQTLFLLGVVICMALAVAFPIWEKVNPADGVKFTLDALYWNEYNQSAEGGAWELTNSKPVYYLAGLAGLIALLALYSIFQFKKRMLQIKLGALNAFLMMIFVGLATWLIFEGEKSLGEGATATFGLGYFLPLGALLFNSLANRFIKKDENLVRSVDRIR